MANLHSYSLEQKSLPVKPDEWIYNRPILEWIFEPSLGRQLPFLYQVFRVYAYGYFHLVRQPFLKGGRILFKLLANLLDYIAPQQDLKLILPNYEIFVDPLDARFFQVVNELTNMSSDAQVLKQLLLSGDTFIDIGANHGSFSIAASQRVGEGGLVIAVEPQPRLAKIIEKSLKLNYSGDFKVYPVAVGDREGEIELLIPQGTSGSAGIHLDHSGTDRHITINVPIKRFENLVNWQDFPGKVVIKLDIEGSESAFLLGAAKMIATLKPTLIIEIHPGTLKAAGMTGEDLTQLLIELGYSRYAEINNLDARFPLKKLNIQIQRNIVAWID
jgi:FkbM family methyltransferase